jgi:putative ABC transport system permease protein
MQILMVVPLAVKALRRHLMRTVLTMLGVIIGVSAVICTIAIGEGASAQVRTAISNIGANLVWVEAGGVNRNGVRTGTGGTRTLTVADMLAIRQQIPTVINVSPQADTRVQLVNGNQNWNASVRGVSPEYIALKNWPVVHGDMFTDAHSERAAPVCVLGQTVVAMLFGDQDPVGDTIRVQGLTCTVIGVLGIKGQTATGQDQDDTLLMPYTTVMKKIKGTPWLDDVLMSAVSADAVEPAKAQLTELLRARHHILPGAPDDFNLRNPMEIAQAVAQSAQTMKMLLASVASVSLLVGGVGIMNIMLVAVTERTREIGLRLAVGARSRDVLRQFLCEAVILSLSGGAIGVALGMLGTRAIAEMFAWPTRVSEMALVLSLGFAAGIGLFFGYYPARRAARLDPIDALRYE